MPARTIIGDCRAVLPTLPAASVHCCVTSPPYFGLRDYGVDGQIGLEQTPDAYVAELVGVFRECRRVLRDDGTLWLNLGDSYTGGSTGRRDNEYDLRKGRSAPCEYKQRIVQNGLKPKDLIGIPWRVAFALQADGWYLRSDIIWSKPNPMPESVTDRPTKAHEYLFLLSKRERYFYDAEAIKEANSSSNQTNCITPWKDRPGNGEWPAGTGGRMGSVTEGRNRRSVWTVATQPFSEAHFATFPPDLIEPCIKAGCPDKCCAECGSPWMRETERDVQWPDKRGGKGNNSDRQDGGKACNAERTIWTLGFSPSCSCNSGTTRGTVLDPFGGAGTTGLVADRLQRNAILIELNPDYAGMSDRRIVDDRGALLDLMEAR